MQYCIKPTKNKVKAHHDIILFKLTTDPETICIYTNGSGIESKIEAAIYSSTTRETKQQYLEQESQSNIFAIELMVIEMTIQIARQHQ